MEVSCNRFTRAITGMTSSERQKAKSGMNVSSKKKVAEPVRSQTSRGLVGLACLLTRSMPYEVSERYVQGPQR